MGYPPSPLKFKNPNLFSECSRTTDHIPILFYKMSLILNDYELLKIKCLSKCFAIYLKQIRGNC